MGKIDLHLHSNASDGRFTPEDLVRKAAGLGLKAIALADHDSVEGIPGALAAIREFPDLMLIPAVEISTDTPGGEVHVLGYFIDYLDATLKASLERFRNSRVGRAEKMVRKLDGLGVHVEWERVKEFAGTGSVGRPHVAQAMLEKGYINSLKEAFSRYIGRNGPAYVEREKMTPVEAAQLVLQSRGMPVLAHPFTVNELEAAVADLAAGGLVGLEAFYAGYTVDDCRHLVQLAEKHGLILTGGSDYHGIDDTTETMMGAVDVPEDCLTRLLALQKERSSKAAGGGASGK